MATLLFEIGVEELPSSFVDAALAALPELTKAKLADLRIAHGELKALGTPRRLAILVEGVAEAQPDLDEEVVGPPETAGFKDGKPTKAAEAFAAKIGKGVEAIEVRDFVASGKQKAGRFLVGRRQEKGRQTKDLLGAALADITAKIPFRKSMRWGEGTATFGRPIQWLVALLDETVVPVTFAGIHAGQKTRGHRFLSSGEVTLKRASDYVEELRKVHVLVDRKEREETMMTRVAEAAQKLGGTHDKEAFLVPENASLVEEPNVIAGSFDAEFLELPASVIRAVARGHQRYFSVEKSEDELLPSYIAVVNTANNPGNIQRGNDRVMRSRLADAKFFFTEDKKTKAETRIEKLAGIVFHARLGTVREKVARIERLAKKIGAHFELEAEEVTRAAELAKSDLVSLMVGEFPELQGHMGRSYAIAAGESARIADAIRDHYKPLGGTDALPEDALSRTIGLADRLDTLVGCFAIGLAPTGTADPFALRRNAIAALRLLAETDSKLAGVSLETLIGDAYDGLEGKKLELSREDTIKKVLDFSRERLRGILSAQSSNEIADAVLASAPAGSAERFPRYAVVKARVLKSLVEQKVPWLDQAKTVTKRLVGIRGNATPVFHERAVFTSAAKDRDLAIHDVVAAITGVTESLRTEDEMKNALGAAEELSKRVDQIFATSLVNDPEDPVTPKRLELLSFGADRMLRLADFSRLLDRG